jgi:hypothetical protein
MKPGDLITCSSPGLQVRSAPAPGSEMWVRKRLWEAGVPALVLSVTKHSLRLEVLIEGETWWVGNLKSLVRLSGPVEGLDGDGID